MTPENLKKELIGLQIHIPIELNNQLKAIAKVEHRTIKNLVEKIVIEFLGKNHV